jgi:hypothetical protein
MATGKIGRLPRDIREQVNEKLGGGCIWKTSRSASGCRNVPAFSSATGNARRCGWSRVCGTQPPSIGWEDFSGWTAFVLPTGIRLKPMKNEEAEDRHHGMKAMIGSTESKRNKTETKRNDGIWGWWQGEGNLKFKMQKEGKLQGPICGDAGFGPGRAGGRRSCLHQGFRLRQTSARQDGAAGRRQEASAQGIAYQGSLASISLY